MTTYSPNCHVQNKQEMLLCHTTMYAKFITILKTTAYKKE